MRAYTVKEIDALRYACKLRWLFGTTRTNTEHSRTYQQQDKDKGVEELVRTHMMAGHVAEDLYAADVTRNITKM